jgi:hypothetical protein
MSRVGTASTLADSTAIELFKAGSLLLGAEKADAVIQTAFDHDFSRFAENCRKDGRAIHPLGKVLKGSSRPLLITSVTGLSSADWKDKCVLSVLSQKQMCWTQTNDDLATRFRE